MSSMRKKHGNGKDLAAESSDRACFDSIPDASLSDPHSNRHEFDAGFAFKKN